MRRNNKIIIFYDRLIATGGAERLAVKFFYYLKKNNYNVEFFTFEINRRALFEGKIEDFRILKNVFELRYELISNEDAYFIVDSGFVKFRLAAIGIKVLYFVHLHHPLFMSHNDMDKFAIIHRKNYEKYKNSNYGAGHIEKPRLNVFGWLYLNLRAIVHRNFIQNARGVFVLSKYSEVEKKDLFNINAKVLRGALDGLREYNPSKFVNRQITKLLMVGRLDRNKRIDVLIRSIAELYEKNIEVVLDIIGTGPELHDLECLVKTLDLSELITFHGFVQDSELDVFYSNAHIFISLDWADYKITMYEALNHSCLVVVTDETEVEKEILETNRVVLLDLKRQNVSEEILSIIHSLDFLEPHSNEILNKLLWENYFNDTCEYFQELENNEILERFNVVWSQALKEHEFYRNWRLRHNLPIRISSLTDLNSWPTLKKCDIQNLPMSLFKICQPISTTGGSSGKPIRVPSSHSQKLIEKKYSQNWREILVGSSKYKVVLIWGHSHLFGFGLNYLFNKLRRMILDWLYGYKRISAYLSQHEISNSLIDCIQSNKTLIIGYSKILYNIIKDNRKFQTKDDRLHFLLTAESLSTEQKEKLGNYESECNFLFEYGMAEFNAIAYKKGVRDSVYHYDTRNFVLQIDSVDQLLITAIYERSFPLIRYETEDFINLSNDELKFNQLYGFIPSFLDVAGRSNDFIELTNGDTVTKIHSEYFTHALKKMEGLTEYRILQRKDKSLEIYLNTDTIDEGDLVNNLKRHVSFDNDLIVKFLDNSMKMTAAGKTKFISIEE